MTSEMQLQRYSLTILIMLFAPAVTMAATLATSGTYDEDASEANTVDQVSTNSDFTLSSFKAALSNAFTSDLGGVIHFDDVDTSGGGVVLANGDSDEGSPNSTHDSPGIPSGEGFDALYGASQSKALRVSMGPLNDRPDNNGNDIWEGLWQVLDDDDASGRTAISGDSNGSNVLSGVTDWDFRFDRGLTAVGISVLSRGDNVGDDVTVALFYDDNTSEVVETDFFIDNTTGDDDTFFGYEAPAGKLITGMVLDIDEGESGGQGIGAPDFTSLDDLAFVVHVPEPTTIGLLGISMLGVMVWGWRRRTSRCQS